MTDILIPLMHGGSKHDNFELRMALRSIEKHLKDYGNIFIVGELPECIKKETVIHIPFTDSINNWQRAWNIYRKIMAGINYRLKIIKDADLREVSLTANGFEASYNINEEQIITLSDNFLFMNDDHYLLADYISGEFPYYHRGEINLESFKDNPPQYKQMKNTVDLLNYMQESSFDFDVHCPILYNKKRWLNMEDFKWCEYGYGLKSLYTNQILDTTYWVPCEDLKFTEKVVMKESIYQALEGRQWFSIGDRVLLNGSKMKEVLLELYPNKSKYELK